MRAYAGMHAWRMRVTDLEQVVDSGQKLRVDAEPRVLRVARLRHQARGEFRLEHKDRGAKERPVREQLEDLRAKRRSAVGRMARDAHRRTPWRGAVARGRGAGVWCGSVPPHKGQVQP